MCSLYHICYIAQMVSWLHSPISGSQGTQSSLPLSSVEGERLVPPLFVAFQLPPLPFFPIGSLPPTAETAASSASLAAGWASDPILGQKCKKNSAENSWEKHFFPYKKSHTEGELFPPQASLPSEDIIAGQFGAAAAIFKPWGETLLIYCGWEGRKRERAWELELLHEPCIHLLLDFLSEMLSVYIFSKNFYLHVLPFTAESILPKKFHIPLRPQSLPPLLQTTFHYSKHK